MNKSGLLIFILTVAMCASLSALAQGSKWGGTEPVPAVKGQPPSPFGATPGTPAQRDLHSCYAYRPKGGPSWQIECKKGSVAACNPMKAAYAAANAGMEVIGCAQSIACFAYNPNGASTSCYVDMAACNAARNRMAQSGGDPKNLGNCVANDKSGPPIVSMPTGPDTSGNFEDHQTCYAYTIGSRVQVHCAWRKDWCEADARGKTTVVLACTPGPLQCFAYNSGANGVCYATAQECQNNRVRMANLTSQKTTSLCNAYTDGVVR